MSDNNEKNEEPRPVSPFSISVEVEGDHIVLACIARIELQSARGLSSLLIKKCDELAARQQVTKAIILPGIDRINN